MCLLEETRSGEGIVAPTYMQQKPCNRHLTIRQGWRLGKPAFEQLRPQHFPKHESTSVKLGLLGNPNAEVCDQGHIRDRLVDGADQTRACGSGGERLSGKEIQGCGV